MTEVVPITLADLPAAAAVLAEANNRPAPENGAERLRWQLFESPGAPTDFPRGWVAKTDGRVVGLMGNVLRRMQWRGRTVWAACTAKYAVLRSHGMLGLLLAKAYFAQPGVDKLFISTGSETSNPITTRFGAREIAGAARGAVLLLRPGRVAHAALRDGGWNALTAGIAGPLAGVALRFRNGVRPPPAPPAIRVARVDRFGADADDLWERGQNLAPILSVRSSAVLNWLFVDGPAGRPDTQILAAQADGRWLGYVVTQDRIRRMATLRRRHVMDIFAPQPDAESALIAGAIDHARRDRCDTLEFRHLTADRMDALARCGARLRALPINPMLTKPAGHPTDADAAADPDAATDATEERRWYLVPADGDGAGW